MRAIAPRIADAEEITIAEDQHEYKPLTAAIVHYQNGESVAPTHTRRINDRQHRIRRRQHLLDGLLLLRHESPGICPKCYVDWVAAIVQAVQPLTREDGTHQEKPDA